MWVYDMVLHKRNGFFEKHEGPLGQRKTPPVNKLHNVTSD